MQHAKTWLTLFTVVYYYEQKAGLHSEDYFIQLRHETDNGELGINIIMWLSLPYKPSVHQILIAKSYNYT